MAREEILPEDLLPDEPAAAPFTMEDAKLKAVLNYHVVSGHFIAREVEGGEMMTLQGSTLTAAVAFGDLSVNGARVTRRDIVTTNGIIHEIDTVILPKNWHLSVLAA